MLSAIADCPNISIVHFPYIALKIHILSVTVPADSGEIVTAYLKFIFQDFLHTFPLWLVLGEMTKTKNSYAVFFLDLTK